MTTSEMLLSLGKATVAYTKFTLDFKKNKELFYCFFEGKDDPKYYQSRINDNIENVEFVPLICNGKEGLLEVQKIIDTKKEYKNAKCLYFIDRDFDFALIKLNSEIYCTPYYSIENFYTTEAALKKVLLTEFNLDAKEEDFKKTMKLFNLLRKKFHSRTTLINAWLACQSDIRIKNNLNHNLNIDDKTSKIFTKNFISEDLSDIDKFIQISKKTSIELLFPGSPKVGAKLLKEKVKQFNQQKKSEIFRGKFELKFLINFLNRLQQQFNQNNSIFSKKHKNSIKFEFCTALTVLSQYALTPKGLKDYIQKFN